MAPAQATPTAGLVVSPFAGAIAAAVGIATDNAVLVAIWVVLVLMDFTAAWIRIFLGEAERWSGAEALKGLTKKFAYFGFALMAGLGDLLAGELIAPAVAHLGLVTKATLAVLIGIEAGSVLRNLRAATGEWRLFRMLTVAYDRIRNPIEAGKERRWYDQDTEREAEE